MGSLSHELINSTDAIVQKWYEAWGRSSHPHPDVTEALLKNKLGLQLRSVGEQLANLDTAQTTSQMWTTENFDPEIRVAQNIPIDELVQEYCVAVDVVRSWIEERNIDVPFREYSYFYRAIFELTAESVRRYAIEEARIVSEDRARYLASLAHQMRGPLSSFTVLLSQLDQTGTVHRGINEKIIEIASRNLNRLISLIDAVLKLERFKPEETDVLPRRVRPADMIDDVFADNAYDAAARNLRLENRAHRSLEMDIDPGLFLDAMSNLVQNAVKVTTSGFVRVTTEKESEDVVFKVSDSGPGIPAEQMKTLFHTVQRGIAGGAGIGLLIVERAVRAQGGTVGVESAPGKGSVFWFRLPRTVTQRNHEGG